VALNNGGDPCSNPAAPKRWLTPMLTFFCSGGITFELKCGHGTTAKPLKNVPCNTQAGCADLCAKEIDCQSCDWSPNSCNMKAEYIPTFADPNWNTWFPVTKRSGSGCPSPRPVEQKVDPAAVKKDAKPVCPEGKCKPGYLKGHF
jgi:hypothetical protein